MSVGIILSGGKQYLVHEGDKIIVERIAAEPETMLEFADLLHGKTVKAKVLNHDRHDKIRVVKFKSKVRYLKRRGHCQLQSKIQIESIE